MKLILAYILYLLSITTCCYCRILVGAPKDHNLQPGTKRSGALWKCPLTTNTTDCIQVYTDGYKGKLLYSHGYKPGYWILVDW